MNRTILLAGIALLAATPALAGSPPVKSPASPAGIAAACAESGPAVSPIMSGGRTGCQNTSTGGAVTCGTDGRCQDYFADPRYGTIKAIIDANRKDTRQQAPI